MTDVVLLLGDLRLTGGHLLAAACGFALGLVVAALAARLRRSAADAELARRLAEIGRLQAEMTGRMQTMAEVFGTRQADLARGLTERMDGLTHRLGRSMTDVSGHMKLQ